MSDNGLLTIIKKNLEICQEAGGHLSDNPDPDVAAIGKIIVASADNALKLMDVIM